MKKKCLIIAIKWSILCLIFGGCIPDESLETLNRLIDTLNRWPTQWEETLVSTINELETMGTNLSMQVAQDLRSVEQEAFQLVTCEIEYLGQFTKMMAMEIRHKHWPNLYPIPPVYTPYICSTEPQDEIVPGDDFLVIFIGFFFVKYNKNFTANIEYYDGSIIQGNIPIAITSDTNLTVDLYGINWLGLHMDFKRSPRLVLHWEGGSSELIIYVGTPAFSATTEYIDLSTNISEIVTCPDGSVATGGGVSIETPGGDNWAQSHPLNIQVWSGLHNDNYGRLYSRCSQIQFSSGYSIPLECTVVSRIAYTRVYTQVDCPYGYIVTGGGIKTGTPGSDNIAFSYPSGNTSWTGFHNDNTGTVYAVCCKQNTNDYSISCITRSQYLSPRVYIQAALPIDYKVTGGGISTNSPGSDNVAVSYPKGDYAWEGYTNDDGGTVFVRGCKCAE